MNGFNSTNCIVNFTSSAITRINEASFNSTNCIVNMKT